MFSNVSIVGFFSNLYPVENSFIEDRTFQSKIHDPFSLAILKQSCRLTDIQEQEYRQASLHCAYAKKDDFPWGTIINSSGERQVVCRCLNTECGYFSTCRPDFDPAELIVLEENKLAHPSIFKYEESAIKESTTDENYDSEAAGKLFVSDISSQGEALQPSIKPAEDGMSEYDEAVFVVDDSHESAPPITIDGNIDFSSFLDSTQDKIIEAEAVERTIVNAGPGTGKTWALIEKIIYMINERKASAENILVLCFSRSAVEVIRNRLTKAVEQGRIGYEWQDVDIRTFDSFCTYMLAWVQDNCPELLPRGYILEANNYDQRINMATSIFKNKKDMLADYEHIIVDEVQDLVGSRAELVIAMLNNLPDTCGFTLLGDSCQALYDYMAEADPFIMSSEQFYHKIFSGFPNANYIALTENHRQDDVFGALTTPYRNAILTGSAQERISEANSLLDSIPHLPIKLTKFDRKDALHYIEHGKTLGILTRTNGQALQISAWLQNADVPHSLHRGLGSPTLGNWIASIFYNYENDSIDESTFIAKHLALFPEVDYETAKNRWISLLSTQRDEARNRYEVSDLLKGLLRNAKDPVLYESGAGEKYAITVSNIHRAKGKEFDSVIVIDDVIEAMASPETEDILEHKVCYVALTRPKKRIERAGISQKDKMIYITRNEDQSKRCSKAGGYGKRYISHFEVGSDTDIEMRSFAVDGILQQYIQNNVKVGMRLKLIKCPEETKKYVAYRIVLEDNENMILGYTSESFAHEAIQHIYNNMRHSVKYEVYPHAFCDVYVHSVTTCISGMVPAPIGSKKYGDISIWYGMTITGFAAVDKDTY